jgi:UTP--glucose-1-phosphate uridylyltransferase
LVRKVIIPAAGLGTRLIPATKEQPKEMLPIFSKTSTGDLAVKPVIQMVYEHLYDAGLRQFCYVVGRGKRGLEDHFTPDVQCIKNLERQGKSGQASDLCSFYNKLETSTIMWVNQPQPKGFGNAVLMAQPFVQNDSCLVHAGDSTIISPNMDYLRKLIEGFECQDADAAFLSHELENPRQYGVIEGREIEPGIIKVSSVIEKPQKPKTNLAIMAMYIFRPKIFEALEATGPGKNGEVQLTDAIQKLVDYNAKVIAVKLDENYHHLDIGSPQRYWQALKLSHEQFCK